MKKSTFVIQTSLFIILGLATGPVGIAIVGLSGLGYIYHRRNKNLLLARATFYFACINEGDTPDEANEKSMRLDHYRAKFIIPHVWTKLDTLGVDERLFVSQARMAGFKG